MDLRTTASWGGAGTLGGLVRADDSTARCSKRNRGQVSNGWLTAERVQRSSARQPRALGGSDDELLW